MIKEINIYWGSDKIFERETEKLTEICLLTDIINQLDKKIFTIEGAKKTEEEPLNVKNLLVYTDDYGQIQEWVLLDFCNHILRNKKLCVEYLWLCNPPTKIYKNIIKNYKADIIREHKPKITEISVDELKKLSENYEKEVIGQPNVMRRVLPAIYALKNEKRKRPVSILFLGASGIGKTETAKYIGEQLGMSLVRIQFSMQQTNQAYQYIFGAEHGEDSLARELIRRESNVVLLDEFDKVSPAFYNAFYQMFDEGLFVDSNYSVDMSRCIVICTTNYRSEEEAEKHLGTPIYSRFSKIVVFDAISIDDKIKIAEKCYQSILSKISEEEKMLIADNDILNKFNQGIRKNAYANMRMLNNDIEDAVYYEILKAYGIIA